MSKNVNKLDQLTSLRFFAAFMIVVHHSEGLFGITNFGVNLGQGVSFFFVLSGFILTYVYPRLDTWPEVQKFWRARIARVWPAYLASILLGFWLSHYKINIQTLIPNLFMIQAWIPLSEYYFSYNQISWSVSTELFFYLAFPLILYRFKEYWHSKILAVSILLVALMVLSNLLSLPYYGDFATGKGLVLSQHGLLYISPLSRVFEFSIGVCIAFAWRKGRVTWSAAVATLYETAAILVCVLSLYYTHSISTEINRSILGSPAALWVSHSGSMFAFGVLIYVLAHGRGKISDLLSKSFLVVLGEISFSLYLIHITFLEYYRENLSIWPKIPNALAFGMFTCILLLSSYLLWAVIEMPGRRLLLGQQRIHSTVIMKKSWRSNFAFSKGAVAAALTLFGIMGVLRTLSAEPNFISREEAESVTPVALRAYAGTNFGPLFTLRGLDFKCDRGALIVRLAWESKVDQELRFTNAIHFTNDSGEILGQADYKQSAKRKSVEKGAIWLDSLLIEEARIKKGVSNIAIALFDDSMSMLFVGQGSTDWEGRRLVIPFDKCSGDS